MTANVLSYKNSLKDTIDLFNCAKIGLIYQNTWETEDEFTKTQGTQKKIAWGKQDEEGDSIGEQVEKEKNKEETKEVTKEETKEETKEDRKMDNMEIVKEENKQGEIDRDLNRVEGYSWLFEESSKELSKQGNWQS